MTTVLQALRTAQLDRAEQYRELVVATAEGSDQRSPNEIEEILDTVKVTLQQFEHDVRQRQHRNQLRAEFAEASAEQQRIAELRAEVETHNLVLERAVQAHQEACRPLQLEIQRIQSNFQRVSLIPNQLFTSCTDERLRSRLQSVTHEQRVVERKIRDAEDRLQRVQSNGNLTAVERIQQELRELTHNATELVDQSNVIVAEMRAW